jgi:hypothetical protein
VAFSFQELNQAMIEECLGAVGATPVGDIDLIGDADEGDVHGGVSSLLSKSYLPGFIGMGLYS